MPAARYVILKYAENPCWTQVVSQAGKPPGLSINSDKKTWSYEGKEYRIGLDMRRCEPGAREGVIGVYDRENLSHLDQMVKHSHEALSGNENIAGPYAD